MKIRLHIILLRVMLLLPFTSKLALRMYGVMLGNIVADSFNQYYSIKEIDLPLFNYFPEMKAMLCVIALIPAAVISQYIGEITGDKDWYRRLEYGARDSV